MNVPVTVYSEMTPNPATMKFVANKYLLAGTVSAEFKSLDEAKGYSPLAEAMFQFPFVEGVFIAANYVAVSKTDNVPWDFINMELREFVKNWITDGKDVLIQLPMRKTESNSGQASARREYQPHEIDEAIRSLLDEFVTPAVSNDGGAIEYLGFDNGVVTVVLRGACSGCPSSTATLKGGIERLLMQHLPEVKEVVAENE